MYHWCKSDLHVYRFFVCVAVAVVFFSERQANETPLLSACGSGHKDVAQLLLNVGAKVDSVGKVCWLSLN